MFGTPRTKQIFTTVQHIVEVGLLKQLKAALQQQVEVDRQQRVEAAHQQP